MRQLRWWGLCGGLLSGVVSAGNNEDLASAFNKAFFDQLKGTPGNQAPQVIEMSSMVPPASSGRPSREAELDQQLQKMVGGPGYTIEFINEDAPVRAENLRQLFPGPLQFDLDGQAQPIREPDPLVMDMLSSMSNMVQEVVAPTLHKTLHASAAPDSCQKDAVAHCSTARSQVHCLGQHRDDISDNCRRDLGKSVPFVCSAAIDKHCDVLHVGILDCLQKYQEELSGDCKDAFLATSKVIKSLNSAAQAPTLRPQTNMPVALSSPSTPSPNQALKNLGALAEHNLDSQLAKFGGLKPTQAPLASAIQQAEKQAEDELIHDADHIEALLTQMSDKISAKPAVTTAAPQQGPSFSVMFVLMVLLLVAYLYFQSEAGRQVWLKLRRVWLNTGKPLLKKGLDGHLGDEEVPL